MASPAWNRRRKATRLRAFMRGSIVIVRCKLEPSRAADGSVLAVHITGAWTALNAAPAELDAQEARMQAEDPWSFTFRADGSRVVSRRKANASLLDYVRVANHARKVAA